MDIKLQLKYYDAEIKFIPRITDDENPSLFEFIDFCYQAGMEAGFSKEKLNKYFTENISKYYNKSEEMSKVSEMEMAYGEYLND